MSSNLRVDRILPAIGTEVGIGTATGSVALYGDVNVAGTLTYEDVTNIDSVGVITARSGVNVTGGSVGIGTDNPQVQLHLTAADPYIRFQDTAAPTGHSQIMGTHQGAIAFSADTSNSVADSHLRFDVDGDEKLRITSDGRLLLGTTNAGGNNTANHLVVANNSSASDQAGISIRGGTSGRSQIFFSDGTSGQDEYRGMLRYDHSENSMQFRTDAVERLRITSGGYVGINEANPTQQLSVHNDTAYEGILINGNNAPRITFARSNSTTVEWGVGIDGTNGNNFAIAQAGNTAKLIIDANGKIGINDTDPRTGLTIAKWGTAPTTNGNTYSMPAGRWVSTWNTSTSNNIDYWAGFGGGGYGISSGSVNIALASNHNNFGQQAGMYIAGEATSASSADFTIGKLVSGSAAGSSDVAGNQRATKSELMRITSDGKMGIGGLTNPGALLSIPAGESNTPRLAIESAVDDNDFTITQYEDGNGTYTMLGQNVKLNSSGNNTILDSGHRTAGILLDARNHGSITFLTGAANAVGENVKITSDGLMGLGTSSPELYVGGGENLVIADSSGAGMTIASGTSNSGTINFADGTSGDARYRGRVEYSHSLDALDILTAATTQIRIDNSGRVLLGTLNSTGTQLIKVNGDTSATTNGGHIALTQGRTSPGNGATHGVISFGTETRPEQVKVVSFVDGTWTDGQYHPSGLYIATTDYNRNSPTEKIRITDIGEVNCYSTGSVIQAGTLQGGGYNAYFYEGRRNQNTGGTRTYVVWSNGNVTNTNNSYGSISDQRLKENIVDATSQWDDIKSLQIRKYNFRESTGNETHTQLGLIAQEAESVSPGLVQTTAVSEGEVLQDADGNQIESVKSINYSVLYMKAVKALQEAQTRIEALEARVTTLEG